MWFGIGIGELVVVVAVFVVVAMLAALRYRAWRWAAVAGVSVLIATLLSPADPFSTVVLGSVFFVFFLGGTRFATPRSMTVA